MVYIVITIYNTVQCTDTVHPYLPISAETAAIYTQMGTPTWKIWKHLLNRPKVEIVCKKLKFATPIAEINKTI